MRLFKYLKTELLTVALILVLLVVQAACDLALPSYTREIIDVGIQQGGIENAVPMMMRVRTFEDLQLFMLDDKEREAAIAAYILDPQGNYKLVATDKADIETLNSIFEVPMLMLSQLEESDMGSIDQLRMALSAGMLTDDQILQRRGDAEEAMGSLKETIVPYVSAAFVSSEYEALGLDLGKIQLDYMFSIGGKMLGLTLVSVFSAIAVCLLASRAAARIGMNLRSQVFSKVLSFAQPEMDQFSTASLITRNTNDIQQIQQVMVMLLRLVLFAPILGVGGIIMVAGTKTGMGWIIGAAVAAVSVLVVFLVRVAVPKFKKMQVQIDKLNLVSREILIGIPVIRAFSRENHEEERFDGASRNLMKTQLFTNRVMAVMMPLMLLIMNVVTVGIVWFGSNGVDVGILHVGDMIAFINYTIQIVVAFMMLSLISIILPRANVASERVDEILAMEPTIKDPARIQYKITDENQGEVSFHNVSFRFPGAEKDVISDISFTAEPGKTTAIIGSTGSGKSTLVHLIPRLYDVVKGKITIDGIDIRSINQSDLHGMIGFVPQKGMLFSGDIESNIKFGNSDITDEAMQEAVEIAQASDFITQKEGGFHSPIAQGGSNVSGGQKQRLSIARAIAKNPKIIVFDDSFSALDYKTDVALRRALRENAVSTTTIIVAQRISTVLHADQILVLEEGRVIGKGNHEELLATCKTYQEIARSQLSDKELGMNGGIAQ